MPPRKRGARRPDPFDPFDGATSATLDLHGFRASEAREHVGTWLARNRKDYPGGLVHLITGKGRGSPGRPVLKGVVGTLLRSGHPAVREFALDREGGGYLIRLSGGR